MRILLTRLSAMGDIVHTWPLAEAIAASGQHRLGWVVEEAFAPLVARHPGVARTFPVATKRWRRHPATGRTWREILAARRDIAAFAAEVALDPQGLAKSALWPAWAGVPRRVGLALRQRRERLSGLFYTEVVHPPDHLVHVIDLNLSLLEALGIACPFGTCPDGRFLVGQEPAPPWLPPGSACLLPATGGAGKAWPAGAYAELARTLQRWGLPVTVVWGPGEEPLARAVAGAAPGTVVAPPTSILELAVVLRHSRVVIGGDTGPAHLAASLGTPTVAIVVATDPRRNGVRGDRAVVLSGASGSAQRGRARTRPARPVSPEAVAEAALALIRSGAADRATMES